jgi:hypothetical protein
VRLVLLLPVACAVFVAASCGGPAFTAGPGGDDGGAVDASGGSGGSGGADVVTADRPVSGEAATEAAPSCGSGPSFACAPAAPPGWTGPLEVFVGQAPLPSCSAGYQPDRDAYDELSAPDATCVCTCGPPKVLCSSPTMVFNTDPGCVTASCASTILNPALCTTIDEHASCAGAAGFYMTAEQAAVGTAGCAPQPSKTVPPLTWGLQARACVPAVAPSQADCPSGTVCAPRPSSPFASTACVAIQGDATCPPGAYSVKRRFFTGATDTRGCTTCACAAPTASCTATIDVYSSTNGSCSGNKITYLAPFTCDGVGQPGDFLLTLSPTSGACGATASNPTGGASPIGPVTVCCVP